MATPNFITENVTGDAFRKSRESNQLSNQRSFDLQRARQAEEERIAVDAAQRAAYQPLPTPQAAPTGGGGLSSQGVITQPLPAPVGYSEPSYSASPSTEPMPLPPGAPPAPPPTGSGSIDYQAMANAINQPQATPPVSAQPQQAQNPSYQQRLSTNLAQVPGGGAQVAALEAQKDADTAKILEMAANGHIDEAKYWATQKNIQIPDAAFSNGDVARALSLGHAAYPDDPDKGQTFYQTFISSPGTLTDKVQAGIRASGPPTTAAQREVARQLAVAHQYFAAGEDGKNSLYNVTGNTATPVTTGDGQPFQPTSTAGRAGAGTDQYAFVNVNGALARVNKMTGESEIVVPGGSKLSEGEMALRIFDSLAKGEISPSPDKVQANVKAAQDIAKQFQGGGGLSNQRVTPAQSIQSAAPPQGQAQGGPAMPVTQQDYDSLPSGSPYIDPEDPPGSPARIKP